MDSDKRDPVCIIIIMISLATRCGYTLLHDFCHNLVMGSVLNFFCGVLSILWYINYVVYLSCVTSSFLQFRYSVRSCNTFEFLLWCASYPCCDIFLFICHVSLALSFSFYTLWDHAIHTEFLLWCAIHILLWYIILFFAVCH